MAEIVEPKGDAEEAYRILLISPSHEDEIKEECLKNGFEVVRVDNADQAVDFLKSRDHVDVAVAAAFMEDDTIFDFLVKVKNMPENDGLSIMIFSAEPSQLAAFCTPVVAAAAKLLGAYKFVTMPKFNIGQLMREIQAMLPDRPAKVTGTHG